MGRRRHPLLIAVSAALLVALLGAAVAVGLQDPEPVTRLPDGTRLCLAGVTFGARQRLVMGPYWARIIGPLLPAKLQQKVGYAVLKAPQTTPGSLAVWCRGTHPPLEATLVDEHGCEVVARYNGFTPRGPGPADYWEFPAFPRRTKTLRIRFYQLKRDRSRRLAAEFPFENPAPGPHPQWNAPAGPVTVREGDLDLTLTHLARGKPATYDPVFGGQGEGTLADFRISRGGKPVREWHPVGAVVSDATGNQWNAGSPYDGAWWGGASGQLSLDALWPDENAWKLRVEFQRAQHTPPDSVATFTGIALPARLKDRVVNAEWHGSGATVRLVGFRRNPFATGVAVDLSNRVYAVLRVLPADGYQLGLRRVTDQAGRVVPAQLQDFRFTPVAIGPLDPTGTYNFLLSPRKDATRLTFTVGLYRSRYAEFLTRLAPPARAASAPTEEAAQGSSNP